MTSSNPAHRVYSIDNVFRVLVQHCSKPLLVKIMMLEKKGTIFDACVNELYREVDYDVIQNMERDNPRKIQYLDAVVHVRADVPSESISKYMAPRQLSQKKYPSRPCCPEPAIALRNQCPNMKTITRENNGRSGQLIKIVFEEGEDTGHVSVHDRIDLVPESADSEFALPYVGDFPLRWWRGWTIEHTVGIIVLQASPRNGALDQAMKAYFLDTDRLDARITELQTGWLPFTISELDQIATSRYPDKKPLSRISSTVEAFSTYPFSEFLMNAGQELSQLHLHTQPHPSKITPLDLPLIVLLIRTECPKLVDLRLPMSFSINDIDLIDKMIRFPAYRFTPGPGTVRRLTILGYNLGKRQYTDLDEILSWNFARNLACLLAPDFELYLSDGPTATSTYSFTDQAGMPTPSWISWGKSFKKAIRFFQRLGPILEQHLSDPAANNVRILSYDFLEDLKYKSNGQPICLRLDEKWPRHKKSKWYASDAYREEQYLDYMYEKEWEEEEKREAERQAHQDYLDDIEAQEEAEREANRQEYQDYLDDMRQQDEEKREAIRQAYQDHLDDIEQQEQYVQVESESDHQQHIAPEDTLVNDQPAVIEESSYHPGEETSAQLATPPEFDFQDQLGTVDGSVEDDRKRKRPHPSGSSNECCDINSPTVQARGPDGVKRYATTTGVGSSKRLDQGNCDNPKKPRLEDGGSDVSEGRGGSH